MQAQQARVSNLLRAHLTWGEKPTLLQQAMQYSVLHNGKRLRPLLVYATGEALGSVDLALLDHAACAIELIHSYSLIHDDLPSLDDDDWRRSRLSCHRAFNEAIAILAGDALQSLAFEILTQSPVSDTARLRMITVLARSSGHQGMIGGEALEFSRTTLTTLQLEQLYALKTAALLGACVQLGAIAVGADRHDIQILKQFSNAVGVGFQIQDDLQDDDGTPYNYVTLVGSTTAHKRLLALYQEAIQCLDQLGVQAQPLYRWLSCLFPNLV